MYIYIYICIYIEKSQPCKEEEAFPRLRDRAAVCLGLLRAQASDSPTAQRGSAACAAGILVLGPLLAGFDRDM